ncbi:uncharacterized protein LOC134231412 [Saccostrea cucullata]|uniref:uncharacterized protein LOC134231412 n=1 Tax=Saccostrea cuccullata TaxID=36930 RepID=UPI002ED1FB31
MQNENTVIYFCIQAERSLQYLKICNGRKNCAWYCWIFIAFVFAAVYVQEMRLNDLNKEVSKCDRELFLVKQKWENVESKAQTDCKESMELSTKLSNQIETLSYCMRGARRITVSFSATVSSVETQTITRPNQVIVFKNVMNNVRDGYNPATGILTVPVSGNYALFFAVEVPGSTYLSVHLSVNSKDFAEALAAGINSYFITGYPIFAKNDRVCVRSHPNNNKKVDIRYTGNRKTCQ